MEIIISVIDNMLSILCGVMKLMCFVGVLFIIVLDIQFGWCVGVLVVNYFYQCVGIDDGCEYGGQNVDEQSYCEVLYGVGVGGEQNYCYDYGGDVGVQNSGEGMIVVFFDCFVWVLVVMQFFVDMFVDQYIGVYCYVYGQYDIGDVWQCKCGIGN